MFVFFILFLSNAKINSAQLSVNQSIYTLESDFSTRKCDMPTSTDPFDKAILPYIKTKEPTKCASDFVYAELDLRSGIIEPDYQEIDKRSCLCQWNALKIIIRSDDYNQYVYNYFQQFNSSIDMNDLRNHKNSDLVLIRCRCSGSINSEKLFSYPNFKLDNRREIAPIQFDKKLDKAESVDGTKKKCPVAPNVVVLVIESLSYLNFKRHMKKTQALFNSEFKSTMVEFQSVIKIGENSYPNMISLITGQPRRNVVRRRYYDNAPLIWKDFEKKRGYYTSYFEDMPTFGLFNWIGYGFKYKNTDYFNRNFYCSVKAFDSYGGLSSACWPQSTYYDQCYKGRNFQDIQFEQIESFMLKMKNENYFIYAQPGYMTHYDFNLASVMDHHAHRFITRNLESLKDSVFLFLGDHGNRYGSQMRTWVGRLESSWPYLAINVPKSVQQKYPNIFETLKQNSKRLVSWIDVHSSLNDLANCNLDPKPTYQNKQTNYSLFTEKIPIDRTCSEALIPSSYCYCLQRQKLATDSLESQKAAEELIKQLNRKLFFYRSKCAELKLSKLIDIARVFKDLNSITYDLVVEALPSKGIFRGELTKLNNNQWKLSDEFERFDKYGNQGDCISNKELQKACYCRIQNN